jgi:phosphomannomutase
VAVQPTVCAAVDVRAQGLGVKSSGAQGLKARGCRLGCASPLLPTPAHNPRVIGAAV